MAAALAVVQSQCRAALTALVHHDLLGCRLLMVLVAGEAQQVLLVWQRQRRVANFAIELAPRVHQ